MNRINWPILLLLLLWMVIFAVAADSAYPQHVRTTSVSSSVDGLAAIVQAHYDEHAYDTVITFTRTANRRWGFVSLGTGFLQIHMDSLVPSDAARFNFKQVVPSKDSVWIVDTEAWLFNGSKRALQYPQINRQANIWCTSVTKTQAKLRVFVTYYPFMPDSVAIIKREKP